MLNCFHFAHMSCRYKLLFSFSHPFRPCFSINQTTGMGAHLPLCIARSRLGGAHYPPSLSQLWFAPHFAGSHQYLSLPPYAIVHLCSGCVAATLICRIAGCVGATLISCITGCCCHPHTVTQRVCCCHPSLG